MGQLIDGRWHDQWYDTQKDGRFQRENAQRRHWLGEPAFSPRAGATISMSRWPAPGPIGP